MRQPLDPDRLRRVLEALGRACRGPGTLYLTGGATALLEGWRAATIDVEVKLDPEPEGVFAAISSSAGSRIGRRRGPRPRPP